MNIKKIVLASLLVLGVISVKSYAADRRWVIAEVVNSTQVITDDPSYLGAMWTSSDTATTPFTNYAVAVNSGSITPQAAFSAYLTQQKLTPALPFTTTGTVTSAGFFNSVNYLPYGVFASSGISVVRSGNNGSNGEALKVFVLYSY